MSSALFLNHAYIYAFQIIMQANSVCKHVIRHSQHQFAAVIYNKHNFACQGMRLPFVSRAFQMSTYAFVSIDTFTCAALQGCNFSVLLACLHFTGIIFNHDVIYINKINKKNMSSFPHFRVTHISDNVLITSC